MTQKQETFLWSEVKKAKVISIFNVEFPMEKRKRQISSGFVIDWIILPRSNQSYIHCFVVTLEAVGRHQHVEPNKLNCC
jgi:hypothetical protein